jgi:hypothetical protein
MIVELTRSNIAQPGRSLDELMSRDQGLSAHVPDTPIAPL